MSCKLLLGWLPCEEGGVGGAIKQFLIMQISFLNRKQRVSHRKQGPISHQHPSPPVATAQPVHVQATKRGQHISRGAGLRHSNHGEAETQTGDRDDPGSHSNLGADVEFARGRGRCGPPSWMGVQAGCRRWPLGPWEGHWQS